MYTWLYLYNSIEIESFMHSFSVVSVNHTDENLQLGVSMFGAGNLFWLTLLHIYPIINLKHGLNTNDGVQRKNPQFAVSPNWCVMCRKDVSQ